MNGSLLATAALAGLLAAAPQRSTAADQVLEFKLVTRAIEVKAFDAKNIEGQSVGVMKAHGVAYFKDGRVASKDFTSSWDHHKGAGPFCGYITYTFDDGSTMVARVAAVSLGGGQFRGDYTVLSGSGAFAGAKGMGSFESMPAKLPDAS